MGAGMMGAGIALVSAQAGMDVVLIDQKQDAADKGKAYVESYIDKGMKRGKVTAEKKEQVLNRITATTDYNALSGCDLIVEAVFEDPGVKAEVTGAGAGKFNNSHTRFPVALALASHSAQSTAFRAAPGGKRALSPCWV